MQTFHGLTTFVTINGSIIQIYGLTQVNIDENSMTCRVTADTIARPGAPSNLTFSALGNGVLLDWNDNPVTDKVSHYNVYRSTSEGGPFSSIATPSSSDYTDTTGSANTLYWYRITATNAGGESDYSAISAEYTSDTTPPGVPVILTTTQVGVNAVMITWTNPTDADFAGVNVYRSTSSGGTYTKLNTDGLISGASYTDLAATAGSHWYYHITSVDTTGNESTPAATDFNVPASDTTPPAVPSSLVALDIHSAIRITWTPNLEPDFASYKIYRSDDGFSTPIATGLTTATYDDATAIISTSYTYKVLARDTSANESAKSAASNSATRTSAPTPNDLKNFTNVGVGLMAPAVAHIRGVNFTQYRITSPSSPPAVVTFTQNNDFNPQLGSSDELHARYDWNMAAGASNPQGSYPQGRGFNYAHVYDAAGTYTATLDRTDPTGHKDSFSTTLVVLPDTRSTVYCSSDGDNSSSNDGSLSSKPVNLARAQAILQSKSQVKVYLRRGDTFNVSSSPIFSLAKDQQMISSSSTFVKSGASSNAFPIINVTAPSTNGFRYFIQITGASHNAVVENLVFDRSYTSGNSTYLNDVGVQIIGAGNSLVRFVTFKNIGKPIDCDQSNATTRYVLIQDCSCPNPSSMQYNFLFTKGADYCFFGLSIADSVQEHGIRISQADRVNILGCKISIGSINTIAKNPINCQQGSFWYVSKGTFTTLNSNTLAGNCQIGPLNKTTATLEAYCKMIVVEECTINTYIQVEDGASFVMIRNNRIGADSAYSFEVYGHGEGTDQFGRSLSTRLNTNVYIYNNTCINQGKNGQIFRLKYSMSSLEFSNNLLIGPNMVANDSGSIPSEAIYLGGIGSNNTFSRNVIPFSFDRILKGSTKMSTAQFNQSGGSNCALDAVTVDGSLKPTFTKGQSTLARPQIGVFSSINGANRNPTDATNTPGAYQL